MKAPRPVVLPKEKYIIPPDPAVVLGQRQPGEHVVVEEKHIFNHHGHAKTLPSTEENGAGDSGDTNGLNAPYHD